MINPIDELTSRIRSRGGSCRLESEKGLSMILIAVILPVIVGFVGIVLEYGELAEARRQMQSAVDAAALAGAQMLPNDQPGAQSTALIYFTNNANTNILASGATPSVSFPTANPGGWTQNPCSNGGNPLCIKVTATKSIPLYLMRYVAGISSQNVTTTATAAVGSLGSGQCPLPIGIVPYGPESDPDYYGFKLGTLYVLKTPQFIGPGNYGFLDFPGGDGGKYMREEIAGTNCPPGGVGVGSIVDTLPGEKVGNYMKGFDDLIGSNAQTFNTGAATDAVRFINGKYTILDATCPRIVVIPIVESLDDPGKKPTKILDFTLFFITDWNQGQKSVSGYFFESLTSGSWSVYSGGSTTVRLIQ